jgi:hypothetical protein
MWKFVAPTGDIHTEDNILDIRGNSETSNEKWQKKVFYYHIYLIEYIGESKAKIK